MKSKTLLLAAFVFAIFLGLPIGLCHASGGLTCSISGSCLGTPFIYLKNSTGGYMNAHAQNASLGTYPYSVCCVPDSGILGYGCGQATVLRLSNETNAHVQAGNYSGPGDIYPVNACLSSPAGEVQCFWGDSCGADYECLASMAGANASLGNLTNAMLGPCGYYQAQVCCRVLASDIWFSPPTPDNNSAISHDWILVNVSSSGDLDSCLLDWHNGTWQNISMAVDGRSCYLNVSGLGQGDYYFRVWANGTGGANFTGTRKVTVDLTSPDLWFSPVTLANQSITANNWITVDVTSNETLDACTLDWYAGAWINVSMVVDGNYCYKTMIGLGQGYYYFRVWGDDTAGNANVTEDRQIRYYIAPAPPSGGDTGGSPGGGGGGPSVQKTNVSSSNLTRSFSLEPDFIKVLIKQGETRNSSFHIKNTGDVEIHMNSEVVSEGRYFVLNLPQNFTLAPNETRKAELYMLSLENMELGVHTGTIYIRSGSLTKQISVVMEVSKKQGLFDVSLEIPKEYLFISAGSNLPLQVSLTNLGDKKRVDVTAIYVIKDMQDHQMVNQRETFAVETKVSFIKNIQIPENAEPGKYSASVIIEYEDQAAVASSEFEVVSMGRPIVIGTNIVIWSIIGGSSVALIALAFILIRRSRKSTGIENFLRSEKDFQKVMDDSMKEYTEMNTGKQAEPTRSMPEKKPEPMPKEPEATRETEKGGPYIKSLEEFHTILKGENKSFVQKPGEKRKGKKKPGE
jgi:hypothetical protein